MIFHILLLGVLGVVHQREKGVVQFLFLVCKVGILLRCCVGLEY